LTEKAAISDKVHMQKTGVSHNLIYPIAPRKYSDIHGGELGDSWKLPMGAHLCRCPLARRSKRELTTSTYMKVLGDMIDRVDVRDACSETDSAKKRG
jgi:hypothetical protein